jgi:hypothetical protein
MCTLRQPKHHKKHLQCHMIQQSKSDFGIFITVISSDDTFLYFEGPMLTIFFFFSSSYFGLTAHRGCDSGMVSE